MPGLKLSLGKLAFPSDQYCSLPGLLSYGFPQKVTRLKAVSAESNTVPVHDPDLSTFTSVGVDSTGKHTQASALPMGIHFNTSFGQASISRSSLWAFFSVVSWVLCLPGAQQGLQPPQSISPLLWGSSCTIPISLFGSVMLLIFG